MKAGNHIAGGIVFTCFFASLWNINIFSNADTLLFTTLFTIFPDIDHTKSFIGKSFYPLARWIDRHYGHRTITHNIFFLAILCLISVATERYFSDDLTYSTILFFSVLSHYILDMITVQGIPFFYPFFRNPCVIPGNPSVRISTNNKRAELIAFAFFVLIGFTAIDLFQQGFWTSYNRAFGTIRHLNSENNDSPYFLFCEYDYFENGQRNKGTAWVLETTGNKAVLFDGEEIITLDKKDNSVVVEDVKPIRSDQEKNFKEESFFNISYDSLRKITNRRIVSGQIQSNKEIQFIENNITKKKKLLKLEHAYNFQFSPIKENSNKSIAEQIELHKIKARQNKAKQERIKKKIEDLKKRINDLKKQEKKANSLYAKNEIKEQIINSRKELKRLSKKVENYSPDPVRLYKIEKLKREQKKIKTYFSGYLSYPVIKEKKLAQLQKN